jgi:hypothetical protein
MVAAKLYGEKDTHRSGDKTPMPNADYSSIDSKYLSPRRIIPSVMPLEFCARNFTICHLLAANLSYLAGPSTAAGNITRWFTFLCFAIVVF